MTAVVETNLFRTQTPDDYLQLHKDVQLPQKRFVGVLKCQIDPFATRLDTTVLSCKQKATKSKKEPQEWEIELEDTVLFPLGGGQPSDTGTIQQLSTDGGLEGEPVIVREVLRHDLDAIHYCSAPLQVGSKVRVTIDAARRKDHMIMHTGQHLLSAIMEHESGLDTVAWALTPSPEPAYVEVPRAPTKEELNRIQERCNEEIAANRSISVEVSPLPAADRPASMPDDYKSTSTVAGVVRVVDIHGLDKNPCCGTHLPSLSFLSSVYILPQTSSVRGTNARVYFLVGQRILAYLSSTLEPLKLASASMNCAYPDLPARIETLQATAREATRDKKRLQEECADLHAQRIVSSCANSHHRASQLLLSSGFNDMNFLNLLSHRLVEQSPQDCLYVLGTGPSVGQQEPGAMVIVGSEQNVKAASAQVKQLFGDRIKGGGKGRYQGKVAKWNKGDEALLEQLSKVNAS